MSKPNNPFITSLNKASAASVNPMNRLAAPKGLSPSAGQRNVFLQQSAGDKEDRENNRNSGNVPIKLTTPLNFAPVSPKPPPNVEFKPVLAVEPGFSASRDRAQLEVRVNGQACQTIKSKDIAVKNVADLEASNVKVVLPEPLRHSISRTISTRHQLLNCFSPLQEVIKGSNQSMLANVMQNHKSRLKQWQDERLKQGLFFYQPVRNHAMDVLKCALEGHPLGKATQLVSQGCNLDILKAYYIVRSVHEQMRVIEPGNNSFLIRRPFTPIPEGQIVNLSEKYLHIDKQNLLKFYSLILNKPATRLRIFKFRQEIDLLWGNLCNFSRESPKNQQTVIEIFIKYWKISSEEEQSHTGELYAMRQKIQGLNMPNELRVKLTAIVVEGLLKQEGVELKEAEFEGPFKEIFQFFFNFDSNSFNFKQAFDNLKMIEVSKQWCKYIQNHIKTIILSKNCDNSLRRCLYIYELLRKIKASKKTSDLPLKLQEELVIKVIKSCSIIMAIIFLDKLCIDVSKPSLAASLMQFSEKDLRYHFAIDTRLIFEVIPSFKFDQIMRDNISIIQRIIKKTIEIGDIETLERQVSNGKVFWFDANDQEGNYHFIKTYCQYFLKCPSFQPEIQTNINEVLKFMKKQGLPIAKSLQIYHMKMLLSATHPTILANHLAFLYEITSEYESLCQYSTEWLSRVESQGIAQRFSNLKPVISLIAQKVIESDEQSLFAIFLMCIRIFTNALQNIAQQPPSYFETIYILYEISKVLEWSRINSTASQLVERVYINIKEAIRKQTYSYNESLRKIESLSPQLRLFMACQLMNEREKLTQSLNRGSSLHQDYRYQFFCKISEDLKKQTGMVVLQTFSLAAKYDAQLFNFLMNKNLANLSELLKCSDVNISVLSHILILGIEIATSSTLKDSQRITDAYNLLNVVVMRVLRSCKDKDLPAFIYLKLFRLCAVSMNKLSYSTHMECLKRGLKGISEVQIRGEMDERFCQYFVYLICLFIAKLKKSDMENSTERSRIITDFEVFRVLADLTLQSQNTLPQLSLFYLQKYIQIVEFFLGFPQLFESISHQFAITVQGFQRRIKQSGEFRELSPLFQRVQNLLQGSTTDTLFKQDQFSNNFSEMYNTTLQKSFTSVARTRVKEDRRREMQQTIKMLQSSSETKIKLNYSLSIPSILDERSIVGIQLMAQLVRKVAWEDCSKEAGKQFKLFLSEFNMKMLATLTHEWISAFRSYLDIYNQLVDSSVFSPFILFTASIKETLTAGFHQLSQGIHFWPNPPADNKIFVSLGNIWLDLNYLPPSWRSRSRESRDTMTIWELIVFRQKIALITTILRFYRIMNGILPNHCLIINELLPFLAFFAENASEMESDSNKEKIRIANDVMERGRSLREDGLQELREAIDLGKLRNDCVAIGETLQYLNVEVPLKTYDTLNKLSYSRTV